MTGAGADPAVPAAHGRGRLAACEDPRRAEVLPDVPGAVGGKISRREPRSPTHDD
ncbi:long-chain fatty acid--CoA ligase [Streptomyces marokkonensis]|uniref:long-chain fatty acid--CoA ligase n=1 Tax=Streptomyces marokkonensis TaxID=324855 RepID=UPI0011F19789|nr:long-chain fatty acid--CoA ligase [Streptomyces marokkonensis]